MIMLVEIDKSNIGFEQLRTNLKAVGESTNTKVHVMHEDIFNACTEFDQCYRIEGYT